MFRFTDPESVMRRALELASRGIGRVEPNPAVGAVVVSDDLELLGEGYHEQCGGPHAEVHALAAAGERARGATLYVTLEPCAHFGRTPPCAPLVVQSGVRRVVAAVQDPAAHADGAGFRILHESGIEVDVGLLEDEARRLIAPFTCLMTRGRPYVHAKWAMTLDGRIATRTGSSQWISGEESRAIVHQLRGRMDAVIIGIGTALADAPLLTARPAGPRIATRIVVDRQARLPVDSRLVRSIDAGPVLLAVGDAPTDRCNALQAAGVEVLRIGEIDVAEPVRVPPSEDVAELVRVPPSCNVAELVRVPPAREASEVSRLQLQRRVVDLPALLAELGRRRMTNVLVEGGGQLLGSCFDARLVDECHVFIAPKLVGGAGAPGPVGGQGVAAIGDALDLESVEVTAAGRDLYVRGCVAGGNERRG